MPLFPGQAVEVGLADQLLRQHPKVHRVDDPLEGSGDDPGTARRADGMEGGGHDGGGEQSGK